MKKIIIGIDVSKSKLDLCVLVGGSISQGIVVSNTISELTMFFKKFLKEHTASDILICCEFTGHYTYPLSSVCSDLGVDLWLENPYHLKHSSGLQRGKSDKVDARRIADYANRYQDKSVLFSFPDKNIASLKALLSERDMYLSHKIALQGQLTDQKDFMNKSDYADKSKRFQGLIKKYKASILAIDKKIEKLIANDATLSNQHELLCTIDGVGTKVATMAIVETNGFQDFDDGRSFACHAGVAPFEHTSGSSIRSRHKVSHKANKSIKALLHMPVLSIATRKSESEFYKYYIRKVAEGKNKMSIINAIKGKIILRMFAVIRENRPYQKNMNEK
jgi:transposase